MEIDGDTNLARLPPAHVPPLNAPTQRKTVPSASWNQLILNDVSFGQYVKAMLEFVEVRVKILAPCIARI